MIWLLFVAVLMINPFPVMSRESRWWFLRKVARLLSSGFSRVEVSRSLFEHAVHIMTYNQFSDFWLGCALSAMAKRLIVDILHHFRDQFCSLTFPLGNIYFIACSYTRGFGSHPFQECSKPTLWGVPFLLGILPFVARFGQSIRRWWDSGLTTHLINVRLLPLFMN